MKNEDLENLMQAEDRDRVHQQETVGRVLVLHLLRSTKESLLTRMIERKDAWAWQISSGSGFHLSLRELLWPYSLS